MQEQYTTVIWDFNGTILSDVELSVEGLNLLRQRRAMAPVTVEEYRDAFGFPVQNYYRGVGFDLEHESFADISREYHEYFFARMHRCRPHRHIPELMRELRERGLRQFVLSAMEETELRRILDELNLATCVDAIYGLRDLLGRSKVVRGQDLMRDHDLQPASAVMIGDTDHDVEVARILGITPISLTLGHQSPHRFAGFDHHRADSVEDLRGILL